MLKPLMELQLHYNVETGLQTPTKVKYDRMNFLLGYDYSKNNNLLSINYRQSYMDMPFPYQTENPTYKCWTGI